jgi:hypothetical protein
VLCDSILFYWLEYDVIENVQMKDFRRRIQIS